MHNISVVIVNYQTPRYLERLLTQLTEMRPQLEDIVVVDNFSQDRTLEMLRERFPEVKVVASQVNPGYAKAVNWGVNFAYNDYVLVLNPDMEITRGAIETLYREIQHDPSIGMIAPKLLNFDSTLQYSCFTFHSLFTPFYRRTPLVKLSYGQQDLDRFLMKDFDHNTQRPVDWVLGSAMLIRRSALREVGPMDERFFLYFEDVDLCRRFWSKGWKVVYCPTAIMKHKHRRLSAPAEGIRSSLNRNTRIHIRSWMQYLWKYRGRPAPSQAQGRG